MRSCTRAPCPSTSLDFLLFGSNLSSFLCRPIGILFRIPIPDQKDSPARHSVRMASAMPVRSLLANSRAARSIITAPTILAKQQRPVLSVASQVSKSLFRSQSRSYADQPIVSAETQVKAKRRGFRTLRILYRLSQLAILGGLGWLGYGIYDSRTPEHQLEPDPTKKTLVVLGRRQPLDQALHSLLTRFLQALVGVRSLFLRNSTRKITMSSSFLLATTSSSLLFFHHVRSVRSNIAASWNRSATFFVTKRPPYDTMKPRLPRLIMKSVWSTSMMIPKSRAQLLLQRYHLTCSLSV